MRRVLARFIHHYPAYKLSDAAFMPLSTFRFLSGEMARHEAEALRQQILANFVKDPQAVVGEIDAMLADDYHAPDAALLTDMMLASLPGGMISRTTSEAIDQRLQEALAKQAIMDAAIATGDTAKVRELMRQFAAVG